MTGTVDGGPHTSSPGPRWPYPERPRPSGVLGPDVQLLASVDLSPDGAWRDEVQLLQSPTTATLYAVHDTGTLHVVTVQRIADLVDFLMCARTASGTTHGRSVEGRVGLLVLKAIAAQGRGCAGPATAPVAPPDGTVPAGPGPGGHCGEMCDVSS